MDATFFFEVTLSSVVIFIFLYELDLQIQAQNPSYGV